MDFTYEALDLFGARRQEHLEAANEEQALTQLHDQGLVVLALASKDGDSDTRADEAVEARLLKRRARQDAVVSMSREFAIMIETGVPIAEALTSMAENSENAVIKAVLREVVADVSEGRSLSEAIGRHPNAFPSLYVSMVASAEIGGTLHVTLNQAADYLEASYEMKRKVKAALTYPALLLCVMFGVFMFLLLFMIPRFSDMFLHMGAKVPASFQAMAAFSAFMRVNWWTMPILAGGIFYGLKRFIAWPAGMLWGARLVLKTPIIGDIVRKVSLARVLRALSSLLDSGVSLLLALETASSVAQNVVFERALQASRSRVEVGSSLSDAFDIANVFPGIVRQMISVGEKSGRLTTVMMHVALYYEREIDAKLRSLASIIEPVMIVFLGIVVGFIAVNIFTPLYSIYDNIK
jgi:type IV pilus assembly protein PilC